MNKPSHIFAEVLEESALEQFNSAMRQDFVVSGALMPDAHKGYSLPIGAVIATEDKVVPAWVGYDISCGMCAFKTSLKKECLESYKENIFEKIYEKIPVGFNINETEIEYSLEGLTDQGKEIAKRSNYKKALGSLGGGNHFIEIGYDENDFIWIVVHSGSRKVGHAIATYYMKKACTDPEIFKHKFHEENKQWKHHNPEGYEKSLNRFIENQTQNVKPLEGHYGFNADSKDGQNYIQDHNWCLNFAIRNRKEMIVRVLDIIYSFLDSDIYGSHLVYDVITIEDNLINRNHNHVVERMISHKGNTKDLKKVFIHRKGATHAEKDMLGVIPANMRDGSFIVKGKGNLKSLYSSSHGAGRVMGRRQAKRELKTDDFRESMTGIKALVNDETLDESPFVYKNIFEVMKQQEELIEVVHHIKPLINIKG